MTIDYKKLLLAFVAAVIIAIPTATVLANKNNQIETERQGKSRLQLDIKKRDEIQRQTDEALKKKADEAEKLKQQNEQLKKDLQAKREKQANDAKMAAAQNAATSASGAVVAAGNCDAYRPLVQKYFGSAAPAAMIVMTKESGCNPNAVSATNDHGLFQLNNMPIYEPEANIRAAYAKYVSPRRGSTPNFSAWYAVCTPNLVPKYSGIWCS